MKKDTSFVKNSLLGIRDSASFISSHLEVEECWRNGTFVNDCWYHFTVLCFTCVISDHKFITQSRKITCYILTFMIIFCLFPYQTHVVKLSDKKNELISISQVSKLKTAWDHLKVFFFFMIFLSIGYNSNMNLALFSPLKPDIKAKPCLRLSLVT